MENLSIYVRTKLRLFGEYGRQSPHTWVVSVGALGWGEGVKGVLNNLKITAELVKRDIPYLWKWSEAGRLDPGS